MIIYFLIIFLLLFYLIISFKYTIFENFENLVTPSSNNKCIKMNEKCVVYNIGSEDESNNCCSGYCVRKNNNFQYKVCSDKPENICGKFNKKIENIGNINITTPSSIKPNSLNDKKNRFCNAAFLDFNLFKKNDNTNITTTPSKDTNLYNPYEKISTNKCGILNIRSSNDDKEEKSGSKCNGFFADLF
jgi:hypothetical protein